MAIRDLQVRGRELGRIRIGSQVATEKGGMRPVKLDSFRFTSPSRQSADAVAELFGGQVRPWQRGVRSEWEVVTTVSEVLVVVPPGEVISQHYELWSAAGLARRCDGMTQQDGKTPCACPPDIADRARAAAGGGACKPITRLSLILQDLPDVGVWLVKTGGYNAAQELAGTAALLARAREQGTLLPARLRLEQRSEVKNGKTHSYGVPVLELLNTFRELTEGTVAALPPAPRRALPAGPAQSADTALGEAQAIAQAATRANTAEELRELWHRAKNNGVLAEFVEDVQGVLVPLENMLYELSEAFR